MARQSSTDDYATPPVATRVLMAREDLGRLVLEPCCGHGHMAIELQKKYRVLASDIRFGDCWDQGLGGVDFLDSEAYSPRSVDSVVTNPPYSLALKIVERALVVATYKVAMFLRIQFLESEARYEFLTHSPLRTVHVFSPRISNWPFGKRERGHNGTACHAWFVWELGYTGKPTIEWISSAEIKAVV